MDQEIPIFSALVGLAVGIFLASFVNSTLGSSLIIGVCVGVSFGVGQTLNMRRLRKQSGASPTGIKPNAHSLGAAIQEILEPLEGQAIPSHLRNLYGETITQWPIGRIGTRSLDNQSNCRFLKKIDLELIRSDEEIDADQRTLREFAENERSRTMFKLAPGSVSGQKINLPWLDVEKALCIGGGADFGDDVWLVLDFSGGSDNPRVLANEWVHGETTECFWREVASSLEEFLSVLKSNTKPRFGDSISL
jgi:hypothetical protein